MSESNSDGCVHRFNTTQRRSISLGSCPTDAPEDLIIDDDSLTEVSSNSANFFSEPSLISTKGPFYTPCWLVIQFYFIIFDLNFTLECRY